MQHPYSAAGRTVRLPNAQVMLEVAKLLELASADPSGTIGFWIRHKDIVAVQTHRLAIMGTLLAGLVGLAGPVATAPGLAQSTESAEASVQLTRFRARLHSVQDGDSFTVLDQLGKRERVRLSGIDAPELEQAGGPQAKAALESLLIAPELVIEPRKRDPFGRWVARVYLERGDQPLRDVARTQLLAGHAWVFNRYTKEQPGREVREDRQAEEQARTKMRGLWADPQAQAPWEFRRQQSPRR
jgi:micrococcal nuclease